MAGRRYGGLRDEVLEETWSGMSGCWRRKTWRSSTLARHVVCDGSPLKAAAGAVMRKHTWKGYGVGFSVHGGTAA